MPIKLKRFKEDIAREQVVELGLRGGFHHRAIARLVYGSEDYVRKVSWILQQEGVSTRDYRNCETKESRERFRFLMKTRMPTTRKRKVG